MDLFGDFGLVGGEDRTANPYQDNQICVNWYCENSPSKNAKVATSLLGAPGLIQLVTAGQTLPQGPGLTADSIVVTADNLIFTADGAGAGVLTAWPQPSTVTNLPVRGLWVLSGSLQALAVIGNTCYLVTIVSYGSSTIVGQLAMNKVGTLATSAGPVSIRDDGLGGYAVIVDGPNGYIYNINTQALTQIIDPAFLGSATVAFIDGWWIFNDPVMQTFYTNSQPYAITFNASYFANKDSFSDKLVGVFESKEELWLLGEKTTEIWYDAGGQFFPFQRLVGTMLQVGCKAAASIARFSSQGQDGLIWLGRSDRGENVIVKTNGFAAEVVSTPAVSNAIAKYPITSDAIGYTYQEDTHEFFVLGFPTADRTWVYDGSMPLDLAWTQRLSYDPYAQSFHRHRSNCYMNFAGMRIVGDYQNGSLYQLTRSAYTDAGWPILAKRRSPHIWDNEAGTLAKSGDSPRGRVFMASLQLDFAPGQGAASGLGANPVAYIRIARDGTTFGQQWPLPMGAIGQYRNRCMIRRLAFGRDNLVDLEVIAPVNRDLVGATLRAFSA